MRNHYLFANRQKTVIIDLIFNPLFYYLPHQKHLKTFLEMTKGPRFLFSQWAAVDNDVAFKRIARSFDQAYFRFWIRMDLKVTLHACVLNRSGRGLRRYKEQITCILMLHILPIMYLNKIYQTIYAIRHTIPYDQRRFSFIYV